MFSLRSTLVTGLLALTASLFLLSSPSYAAGEYYKWVDENGVTHYGSRKPHGVPAESISVVTGSARDAAPQSAQATSTASSASTSASESEATEIPKDPERCRIAQENMKALNGYARIREQTEDGEFRYLSEDEKTERKASAQKIIDDNCE